MALLIDNLIKNVSSDPLLNLEMAANFLAKATGADCFILADGDGAPYIITKSGVSDALAMPDQLMYANLHRWPITANAVMATGHVYVMCVPMLSARGQDDFTNEKRQIRDSYMPISGYVYFQSLNAAHCPATEFVTKNIEIFNLLSNFLGMYHVHTAASTDKMTGALNRRYMDLALEAHLEQAKLAGSQFAVVMIDLDHFKHVNDTYGHLAGDDVLRAASAVIMENLRKDDVLGRYGGEEFIVLLRDADHATACSMADLLRTKIANAKILGGKRDITASLGISVYPDHADTIKTLVDKADMALSMAKECGRNRHEIWNENMSGFATAKSNKQSFFTGDIAKDAKRMQELFALMRISRASISITEKINMFLDRLYTSITMMDITLFLVSDDKMTDSFRLTEAGIKPPEYNDKIIFDAIQKQQGTYMVDWDNDKIHIKTGSVDLQSICVAPAVSDGIVKGVLYISISAKTKEFAADEMAFVKNAAIVIAAAL
ncbi:MAG: GGDEF domain-containing protein [Defluviitaleaceae bacterium]|nr:GGDEF domain-containing protein [Defluviitaleaceae bacterium]